MCVYVYVCGCMYVCMYVCNVRNCPSLPPVLSRKYTLPIIEIIIERPHEIRMGNQAPPPPPPSKSLDIITLCV